MSAIFNPMYRTNIGIRQKGILGYIANSGNVQGFKARSWLKNILILFSQTHFQIVGSIFAIYILSIMIL